jgi:hypothetical protein
MKYRRRSVPSAVFFSGYSGSADCSCCSDCSAGYSGSAGWSCSDYSDFAGSYSGCSWFIPPIYYGGQYPLL